jgi:small subunit ribosomal protein S4
MARYTGPKDRQSRRENFDLFGKGPKLPRLYVFPGVHGPKGQRRAPSQYGRQLREKQKVKRMYGVLEKQFSSYMADAMKTKGNTVNAVCSLLERRLDNVVFRLGFTNSRPQARQLVSHRHVLVNGKKVSIASYQVKPGDVITLTPKAMEMPTVSMNIKEEKEYMPAWLSRKAAAGNIVRIPSREDVPEPFQDQDIIEFYSR